MLDKQEFREILKRKTTNIFFTSDLHFGHANIIRLAGRPFTSVEEMDAYMIKKWNEVVGQEDVVFVLGDFAYKGNHSALHYLDQLKGYKVLVVGNHDSTGPELVAWDAVYNGYKEIRLKKKNFVLSHYPITSWNGAFKDTVLLYGHVHASGKDWEKVELPNAHNVNVEFHNYTPINIKDIKVVNFKDAIEKLKR